jgi:glycosyltransferase involved in cell wall biosynthesis
MTAAAEQILLLADSFSLRGTSAYTLRLAEHLPALGFRTQIVCPCAHMVRPDHRNDLSIAEYPQLQTPVWGRLVRRWLLADLQDEPPALIHVQSRRMLSTGNWLAKRLRCPLVLTMHDFLGPRERFGFSTTWGRRIIAVSDVVQRELVARYPQVTNLVSVIVSGVDLPGEAPRPVLDPARSPVVGAAGQLEPSKGFLYFLGAAQRLVAANVPVEFLIAGGGPEEAALRRLARKLGIADRVTFVPNVRERTTSILAMDIFCLPSLRQGLGTLMLEAMALGRPVIASAVDGVDLIVRDHETGLLVPPGNSELLAQRMLELLRDPMLARRLATAASELVRREFSAERMVQQTAALYRSVLEQAANRPTTATPSRPVTTTTGP